MLFLFSLFISTILASCTTDSTTWTVNCGTIVDITEAKITSLTIQLQRCLPNQVSYCQNPPNLHITANVEVPPGTNHLITIDNALTPSISFTLFDILGFSGDIVVGGLTSTATSFSFSITLTINEVLIGQLYQNTIYTVTIGDPNMDPCSLPASVLCPSDNCPARTCPGCQSCCPGCQSCCPVCPVCPVCSDCPVCPVCSDCPVCPVISMNNSDVSNLVAEQTAAITASTVPNSTFNGIVAFLAIALLLLVAALVALIYLFIKYKATEEGKAQLENLFNRKETTTNPVEGGSQHAPKPLPKPPQLSPQ